MKTSIVLPLQDPSPLSPFEPGKFDQNLKKLEEFGYDGVELGITDPNNLDKKKIHKKLKTHGLTLSAITTGQAYGMEGISFTEPQSDKRKKAIRRIKSQIDFATNFDNALVIIGLIRGVGQHKLSVDWLKESLGECVNYADKKGARLAFEPLNRYETNLINTVEEATELLDEINTENFGLLFDTFHANIEEPSITESIRAAGDKLFYVHIADSNRWPPNYGHIDFNRVSAVLREIDYTGFCSLESLPKPTPNECIRQGVDFIGKL